MNTPTHSTPASPAAPRLPSPAALAARSISSLRAALGRLGAELRLHWILATAGLLVLFSLGGGGLLFFWMQDLPAFGTLKDYQPLIATRVFGSDGSEVFEFFRERRTVVPFEEIPLIMRQAVLAAEDAQFYEHEGINYLAIARCAIRAATLGRRCGGSTITQQVVKTFLLSPERRLSRKVKEVVLARRLEKNLSKDEILYLYLNQIYLGHRRYGVEEASRFYFGKSVRQLTLGEAATLAGVINSPERLSPVKHPAEAKNREQYVLRRMVEEKFISEKQAQIEVARPILVAIHPDDPPGAWYADAIRKYLDARYGADRVETDGLQVDVAMDPYMQRVAEKSLEDDLRAVDRRQGWRGALHHLDPKQLSTAMPLWRERLKAIQARPNEALIWDLTRVSSDDVEPGTEARMDVRKMARVRPLEAEENYNALVSKVTAKEAIVDLGNATGVIALADAAWARKFNPVAHTAAPKAMTEVVKPGDIVLVRVVSTRPAPQELVRLGKPIRLALEQLPKVQGALVAIDPVTRGVRALVGGYDFNLSKFNRAIQAHRQPGSAFKPFVWGTALESRRYTPASLVYDTPDVYRDPWTGKEWKPQNFERDAYDGPLLLGAALAHSKNTVSVKLVDTLGADTVIQFAHRAGIGSELPKTLSLALGTGEVVPLEMVNAYATIAAQGFYTEPMLILRVRDRKGVVLESHPVVRAPLPLAAPVAALPGGAVLPPPAAPGTVDTGAPPPAPDAAQAQPAAAAPPPPEVGMRPEVAFVLESMMREVIDYGTGAAARALGRPAAGKTGTAQDHRDAWFVGFSPEVVAGVWIGFDSHEPLGSHETGAGAALPAWLRFMQATAGTRPPVDFQPPSGVEFARIDPKSGLLARDAGAAAPAQPGGAESRFMAFITGTAPTQTAPEPGTGGAAPQSFFQDDH